MSFLLPIFYDKASPATRLHRSRLILLLGGLAVVLLLLLGYSSHGLGALPLSAIGLDRAFEHTFASNAGSKSASRPLSIPAATRLQNELFAQTGRHVRPTCSWTSWHDTRFAPLRNTNRRIMITILLHQNEGTLASFAQELPVLLEWVGAHNAFVSIYESGSTDRTTEWLRSLGGILDALSVKHQIVSLGDTRVENAEGRRRIPVLAAARNAALAPLFSGQVGAALGGEPDEIYFLNDIYFCAPDLLEVLLQYRQQGMHQACATDWDELIYDRWVLRAISGRSWWRREELIDYFSPPRDYTKELPGTLLDDEADRRRWESHLPLQVFSCWNGATVIDAKAFLPPHNMRFRQSKADWEDESHSIPLSLTSKASECFLSSVDLWKLGFNRIAIIPKASVAYGVNTYDVHRKDGEFFAPKGDQEVFEWIGNWKETPPKEVSNQDYAYWHVTERFGPWDEQ
ncbi:glycosyltransferase family 69 protein [Peniophora sp. CONT]|nr:glycosyltransferase family 69 protein [Peniophora sp. CONT]